ncbi:MAG: hypothetical protein GX601_16890, partial [Anaerolineales bacterium]|nr:hypothetical protein [Anaerolineales bacterium]
MSRTSFLEDKRAQPRELAVALVCALLLTTGVGMASPAAPAAVITVTGAADDADISNLAGNGMCDLREAITAANTDAPVGECPGGSSADTIQFSVTTPVTITLGAALPPITGTLTISGPGRSALGIDGADLYRPFWIETGATAEISGMTLARGYAPTTGPSQYRGGAVFNRGTLTLRNVSILDSNGISYGGGIHNEGALTLEGVLVAGCSSATYGGGVQGEPGSLLVIDHDSQIGAPGRPNVASLYGAGIYLDRATAVISGAISYNSSGNVGGGLYCEGSTVTLQNATIESNTAGQGGGIHSSNSVLTIISSRIVSNTALFGGWYGGLDVVTSQVELTRSAVVSNTASGAAGIGVSADSVVTLTHSVVLYNTSVDGSGGGVLVYGEGTLTLDSSTVANNATLNSEGGGVNVLPGGAAIIRNSTISGNSAAGYAGGIN